jgi:putative endonuclease
MTHLDEARLRRSRFRRGRWGETKAAWALALTGYRVVARRYKTTAGEIDLVAIRGQRVAFVEVKARSDIAAAEAAITVHCRRRVRRAAQLWVARHPDFQHHTLGFDLVLVVPWSWPQYRPDAL